MLAIGIDSQKNKSGEQDRVMTDASGHYRFSILSDRFWVAPETDGRMLTARPALRTAGGTVDFVLTRGAVVAGRMIHSQTGKPVLAGVVAGAVVEGQRYPCYFGMADAQGRFRVRVPAGAVYLDGHLGSKHGRNDRELVVAEGEISADIRVYRP